MARFEQGSHRLWCMSLRLSLHLSVRKSQVGLIRVLARLAHEVHLVPRAVVSAALQPAGLARVTSEVVPRSGVELVVVEVVPRQRHRLERHALSEGHGSGVCCEDKYVLGVSACVHE